MFNDLSVTLFSIFFVNLFNIFSGIFGLELDDYMLELFIAAFMNKLYLWSSVYFADPLAI
jgi:hypothetical protein